MNLDQVLSLTLTIGERWGGIFSPSMVRNNQDDKLPPGTIEDSIFPHNAGEGKVETIVLIG